MAKPEKTFKCQNVRVTIWPPGKGPRTAEVSVSYQKDGEWKHTSSLGPKDVLVAAQLLKRAGQYMIDKEGENGGSRARTTARTKPDKGDEDGPNEDHPF